MAQNSAYTVEYFHIEDGLSQNTVNVAFIDSKGFLWVGTQDGLNKYNGYEFEQFRYMPEIEEEKSISNNFIRSIIETKKNDLIIVTQDGLNKYSLATGIISPLKKQAETNRSNHKVNALFAYEDDDQIIWLATENGLEKYDQSTHEYVSYNHNYGLLSNRSRNNIYTIIEDKKNTLWMGSKSGLVSFSKTKLRFTNYNPFPLNRNSKNEVFSVFFDTNNKLWVGTNAGLFKFDQYTKKFTEIHFKEKPKTPDKTINTIYQDNLGTIWVGTVNGLFHYNSKTKFLENIHLFDKQNFEFLFQNITSITQDKSSILWVGTVDGLIKLNLKKLNFSLCRQSITGQQFASKTIHSIFSENDTIIWLGTRSGGLSLYNRISGEVTSYSPNNKTHYFPDLEANSIFKDRQGNIWVGSQNGIYIFNRKSKTFVNFTQFFNLHIDFPNLTNNRVLKIIQDKKGGYWFATSNGLFNFDGKTINTYTHSNYGKSDLCSNSIFSVLEDYRGKIWIVTGNGLNVFDPKTKKFDTFLKETSGLSNNSLLSIFESKDSTIWIGSETGLNRLKKGEKFFTYFTQTNGLVNDFIYSIEEDIHNNLWVSTNRGISMFNPKTKTFRNFDLADGLQGYEFNLGASFNDNKGQIFFGGINGYNSFYTDSIHENAYIPDVTIIHFVKTKFGKDTMLPIPKDSTIYLRHNENSFKIDFCVLEFTMPSKNKFKYRLLGLDESDTSWITTYDNYASYLVIPSGDYSFELKGANNDGKWGKNTITLKINIETPWYRTILAYIIYILLGSSIILLIIYIYANNAKKEKKQKLAIREINKTLEKQQKKLKEIVQETQDSITYANRIITAMMPSESYFKKLLPESFVYFKPKSVVSGDFCWVEKQDGIITVTAVDCTGHGVPGAFMSIVGMNLLRTIMDGKPSSPAQILNEMDKQVTKIFEQKTHEELAVRDGMDMSLCMIDTTKKIIQFAGAINPLYIIRNNELIEVKGNRFSIGASEHNQTKRDFTNHTIFLENEDVIYLFSDGFADQFGGQDAKKFKFKRFRHMLLMMNNKPTYMQKEKINETFENWRGEYEQIDDIIIIGIKPLAGRN